MNKDLFSFTDIKKLVLNSKFLKTGEFSVEIYINDTLIQKIFDNSKNLFNDRERESADSAFCWLSDNGCLNKGKEYRLCSTIISSELILKTYCEINKIRFFNFKNLVENKEDL